MRFLLKLAWQDLRGSGQSLWVLCACLVLGVTLVAATGGLYQQVWQGLQADSRQISGGDLQVESRARLPAAAISWMQARGQVSLLIELDTMMGTAAGDFQLVEVQSVDQHYPLYGALTLDPPVPLTDVTRMQGSRFGLAMDPVLADRLNISIGEVVEIGALELEVRALITEQPDRSLTASWRGSPVMISEEALLDTGLLRPGSRVEYEYRVRTDMDLSAWQRDLFAAFSGTDWQVSTFVDSSDRIGERLAQAGSALLIVGFSTLFIGGLGVFNSVQAYLQGKLGTIATLRSIGLRDQPLALVYLLQILIMSCLSCIAGAILGLLLSSVGAFFIETQVRVEMMLGSALLPSVFAGIFGLLIAMTFAAPAIGRALSVDPAILFRSLDGVATGTPPRLVDGCDWRRGAHRTDGVDLAARPDVRCFVCRRCAVSACHARWHCAPDQAVGAADGGSGAYAALLRASSGAREPASPRLCVARISSNAGFLPDPAGGLHYSYFRFARCHCRNRPRTITGPRALRCGAGSISVREPDS